MITKIDHLVITTTCIEDCLSFYQKLGFKVQQGNGRYELFAGNFKINVHLLHHELQPCAKRVQPGSADLCFEITGCLNTYKQMLMVQGINIEFGPVSRLGVRGEMQSFYIRDLDGNLLEFCSYQP